MKTKSLPALGTTFATTLGLAVAAFGLGAPAWAAPAPRFLQDAVSGDNGEVALGRLAQQRSRSPAVRSFGRTLEQDHGAHRGEAIALARRLRITVAPNAMAPEAAQTRRRLMRLSGPVFDREFARAMVQDHRKDIAAFEAQARSGDRATAGFARDTLPHLHHHLDMAQALR